MDVHTALGPFGHDSLLVTDVAGQPGHVIDMASVCAALGGDGTAEGLENIKGEGYHVEVSADAPARPVPLLPLERPKLIATETLYMGVVLGR